MQNEPLKKISIIILASGNGKRFSKIKPKQYYSVNNKTILEITIDNFLGLDFIDHIIVTVDDQHKLFYKGVIEKYKRVLFINGGQNRQHSSYKAIKKAKKLKSDYVMIHDAARPLTGKELIIKLYKSLKNKDAVIPVLKIKDSIKVLNNSRIEGEVNREKLFLAQTPQAFKLDSLYKCYKELNLKDLESFTDDAQIYNFKNNKNLYTITGDANNIKITEKEDLIFVKNILERNSIIKVGQGFDVHSFTTGNFVKLFGLKIPFEKGLLGHSDADVGIHAIIDALLGTASEGDIGTKYPDNKLKYKNIDSKILLKDTFKLLRKKNIEIVHIDNTVICEKPKINKHVNKMKKIISKILLLETKQLSIKATTTEKLGFLGRKEGVAVLSTATVKVTC